MPKGPTAKSVRTRGVIEAAARELFAEQGFERTTIREIATAAGADPALVIRYFGSKDALFGVVAEPDLHLPDLSGVPPRKRGEALVAHFLDIWESGGGMPVLLRSAASNDAAAERLRAVFARQVMPVVAEAGALHTASERAGLVSSQLLGLALTRYILQLPPMASMKRDTLVREIGATIQRYLDLA